MTEVRARAARHKGQLNFGSEIEQMLFAFGDDTPSLPETIRVLDELATDFIIEICHQAARSASYSNRQKIKLDDFHFAIRRNEPMLGRVQELLQMDKTMKMARSGFDTSEGYQGLQKGRVPQDLPGLSVEGKKRRGRRRKSEIEAEQVKARNVSTSIRGDGKDDDDDESMED